MKYKRRSAGQPCGKESSIAQNLFYDHRANLFPHTETPRRYVKKFKSGLTAYCYRMFCILPFSGKRYNMSTE